MDNQSQLLRINSKFRNDPSHSSTTNFTYSIPSNQSSESVRKIELVSFNMNRQFYNIASYNNSLTVQDGFSSQATVFITPNNYTIETLLIELNSKVYDLSVGTRTLTWTIINDRLQVVASGATTLVIAESSSIGPYIGLVGNQVVTQTPTPLPSVPQLQGGIIYVQSFVITGAGCLDSSGPQVGGLIPLCAAIPTSTVPFGFDISWQKNSPDSYYTEWPQGISLRSIDIRLCTAYGDILEVPPNVDVDLIFRIYY